MPHSVHVSTITFKGERTPYSERFQDVYFAPDSGIEESTLIYLGGTELEERLKADSEPLHTVGEVGFGVGLNFLLTLRLFKTIARPDQRLHYFSAEQYPVCFKDLQRLYSLYPELQEEAQPLLDQYPVLTPGVHELRFLNGRVVLHLMLGSALKMFQWIETPIHTWYWDGFTPMRNPDAFSEELFCVLASKSAPGAKGASFTSATWVRRGLESAQFLVEKRLGFAQKRERIVGTYQGPVAKDFLPPWFSNRSLSRALPGRDRVAVVGAGLAGSAVANRLAIRGFEVTVFDPRGIATRASGNKAALFNIQMSRQPNPISRFAQAALASFLQELKTLDLLTDRNILRADKADLLALKNSEYPEDFYQEQTDGVLLPHCGFLSPVELCRKRLAHPKIKLMEMTWPLGDASRADFQHVVYCQGADLKMDDTIVHPILNQFPVRPIRGQILELLPTERSKGIACTRVLHGYVTPLRPKITGEAVHVLGATYQAKNISEDQEAIDRDFLMAEAKRSWPEFSEISSDQVIRSRVGYRLSTPDKLPMIGPIVNPDWLKVNYERALKGTRMEHLPNLQAVPGEWCLLGLGSRGTTFSALGAEILVSVMMGEPLPIELELWPHLHSARFFIRNLRKNTID